MNNEHMENEERQIMTFLDEEGNKVEFEAVARIFLEEFDNSGINRFLSCDSRRFPDHSRKFSCRGRSFSLYWNHRNRN